MELMFAQALILVFLLTYLWTEEVILRPNYAAELAYYEDMATWFWDSPHDVPEEDHDIHWVAGLMGIPSWHPLYGAKGWGGL